MEAFGEFLLGAIVGLFSGLLALHLSGGRASIDETHRNLMDSRQKLVDAHRKLLDARRHREEAQAVLERSKKDLEEVLKLKGEG